MHLACHRCLAAPSFGTSRGPACQPATYQSARVALLSVGAWCVIPVRPGPWVMPLVVSVAAQLPCGNITTLDSHSSRQHSSGRRRTALPPHP